MSDSPRQRFDALVERARREDGRPPFSPAALTEFATGARELIWLGDAAALATPTSAEFVVDPDHRRVGQGAAMLSHLMDGRDSLLVVAHGDHPGAKALAARYGFEPELTVLHLHASVNAEGGREPWVTTFREEDTDEWLALNARAFAHHPVQGAITRAELETTMAEPWFKREDFLLFHEHKRIVAYSWMKLEESIGEFYVVGVDPDHRGQGLGRRMVDAGFAHLADRGIRSAKLNVESDNIPALRLYHSMGFTENAVDVRYRWARSV
jgi:mycothiol synthase